MEEQSTCKFCFEPIMLIGFRWLHKKTDKRRCAEAPLAEPIDTSALAAAEATGYDRGFNEGRRVSNNPREDNF
jgi:hypothetical protein